MQQCDTELCIVHIAFSGIFTPLSSRAFKRLTMTDKAALNMVLKR